MKKISESSLLLLFIIAMVVETSSCKSNSSDTPNSSETTASEITAIEELLSQMPGFIEIKEFHPEVYKEMMSQIREYTKQKNLEEIRELVKSKVQIIFQEDITKAPPDALILYLDSTTELIEYAKERNPVCCDQFLQGDTRCMEKILNGPETKKYLEMMGTVIRKANTNPSATEIDKEQATSDMNDIILSSQATLDDSCLFSISVFNGLTDLPPDRTANAVKYMLSAEQP